MTRSLAYIVATPPALLIIGLCLVTYPLWPREG